MKKVDTSLWELTDSEIEELMQLDPRTLAASMIARRDPSDENLDGLLKSAVRLGMETGFWTALYIAADPDVQVILDENGRPAIVGG